MHKFYEVIIKPKSLFGTPLAGDTFFGHLCWQFVNDENLLFHPFARQVSNYCNAPFLVASSAVLRISCNGHSGYAMPRPELALFNPGNSNNRTERKELLEQRKEMKKRKYLFVGEELVLHFKQELLLSEGDAAMAALPIMEEQERLKAEKVAQGGWSSVSARTHNSINRLTQTTGKGFDPYTTEDISYLPGVTLSIFIAADDAVCSLDALTTACRRIGSFGYGRDASSGRGRFEVLSVKEKAPIAFKEANCCYTLAPCVPKPGSVSRSWFQPLTRFGKHGGGAELQGKPFKNPVVMAAEGAVFEMQPDMRDNFYIGSGVTGISKVIKETVVQGYSLYIPCSVEV
jgi:CRISPR-associated protein Csm4